MSLNIALVDRQAKAVAEMSFPASLQASETGQILQALQKLRLPLTSPGTAAVPDVTGSLEAAVFSALAAAKVETSRVAMHLAAQQRHKLFTQLDRLHEVDEWEEGDRPMLPASFSTFLRSMLLLRPRRWPSLGLSAAGNLLAVWGTPGDRLTLEFFANDRVRWSLSVPDEDGPVRSAGEGRVLGLGDYLQPFHPERWLTNADDRAA